MTDWKRKDGRKKERREESAWSSRCGTMGLLGAYMPCIVGGKEDSKEGRGGEGTGFPPEGRKEGRKRSYSRREIESTRQGPGVLRAEKRPG